MLMREATADDWPDMWEFMRGIVAAGETYAYPHDLDSESLRAIWFGAPPARTVVAVDDDGTVLGTAKMGPNHGGGSGHVSTASFMVDPASGRSGVGRALGEHVLDQARTDGYLAMQFNAVVESNTRAVALWKSLGFDIIGTVPQGFHHPELGYVGLHIMHRFL